MPSSFNTVSNSLGTTFTSNARMFLSSRFLLYEIENIRRWIMGVWWMDQHGDLSFLQWKKKPRRYRPKDAPYRRYRDSLSWNAGLTQWTRAINLLITKKKTKLHGLSPRANYTDREKAACRRSDCQLLRIEGATWSAWRIPTAVFSVF
jgi:hypothetical protein